MIVSDELECMFSEFITVDGVIRKGSESLIYGSIERDI